MIDYVGLSYERERPLMVQELAPGAALTPDGRSVLSLVGGADGRAWAFEQGERAELRFPVPPSLSGMARSYLVRTTGWYTIHVPTGATLTSRRFSGSSASRARWPSSRSRLSTTPCASPARYGNPASSP
jgi:hypothetical protein